MLKLIRQLAFACGSQAKLAEKLGISPSAISNWKTDGDIPADRWRQIKVLAEELEVPVKAEDFFAPPPEAA